MLYVVGGCSRSGKSLLAQRMRVHHGIPWFPLDALKMGLHLGAPKLGIQRDGDDLRTADAMWPMVEPILDHFVFDGRDYLVEGVNLRPATIAHYIQETDPTIRACFLSYPHIAIETKIADVAGHAGPPTDWLHRTGPDHVRRYLEVSRSLSIALQDECQRCGIPFVDTGFEFLAALSAAERTLQGSPPESAPLAMIS